MKPEMRVSTKVSLRTFVTDKKVANAAVLFAKEAVTPVIFRRETPLACT